MVLQETSVASGRSFALSSVLQVFAPGRAGRGVRDRVEGRVTRHVGGPYSARACIC